MKTFLPVAAVIVFALGGCQRVERGSAASAQIQDTKAPKGSAVSPASTLGFPASSASYQAEYLATDDDKSPAYAVKMEVSGGTKFRFEQSHPDPDRATSGETLVVVFDDQSNRSAVYALGPGAPKSVVVMSAPFSFIESLLDWASASDTGLEKAGREKIAGLECDIWRDVNDIGNFACLTQDGILLNEVTSDAKSPALVATKVARGPIDAKRFSIPQGFEVIDMAPCEDVEEQAQNGVVVSSEAMQRCASLSAKFYAIAGDVE